MQVSKELISGELERLKLAVEEAKALLHQRNGAVVVLQDLLKYLELPDPPKMETVPPELNKISEENARIQSAEEKRQALYAEAMEERAEMADAVTDEMVEEAVYSKKNVEVN